jgi:glutathione S-transferase
MLPALELDGRFITESDVILAELEKEFGPLGEQSMHSRQSTQLRRLERGIFSAWCGWLCYRQGSNETQNRRRFEEVADVVERVLEASPGDYFMGRFSSVDVIFVPYLERMSASLYYYKGFKLRDERARPNLCRWFAAMESRPTYRGTQSDAHTHAHDLPPQMGGCYESGSEEQQACRRLIDHGPYTTGSVPDCGYEEPESSRIEAVGRLLVHKDSVVECAANGTRRCVEKGSGARHVESIDEALRCAATALITGKVVAPSAQPGSGVDAALRYVRDRVNVPRDMSIWAARRMREALEGTASCVGDAPGPSIPFRHRRDQNPEDFGRGGELGGKFDASKLR